MLYLYNLNASDMMLAKELYMEFYMIRVKGRPSPLDMTCIPPRRFLYRANIELGDLTSDYP